jgi:hypothetical protein
LSGTYYYSPILKDSSLDTYTETGLIGAVINFSGIV